ATAAGALMWWSSRRAAPNSDVKRSSTPCATPPTVPPRPLSLIRRKRCAAVSSWTTPKSTDASAAMRTRAHQRESRISPVGVFGRAGAAHADVEAVHAEEEVVVLGRALLEAPQQHGRLVVHVHRPLLQPEGEHAGVGHPAPVERALVGGDRDDDVEARNEL